jgi:regulator of RNase E activity RraA
MNGTTYPDWLTSTLASDATGGRNVLPDWIKPLKQNSRVVRPAFVVLAAQDDNLAVVQALKKSPPQGCVMVVAGMSTSRTATIGGLMGLEMQSMGIIGLITDGLVRDAGELRNLDFQVWSRGVTPIASNKISEGATGIPVTMGGVQVRDGDLIIADDDGVVVWQKENIEDLLQKAKSKLEADNLRLERLLAQAKKDNA